MTKAQKDSQAISTYLFALLGSSIVKAAHKMLGKLTPV